MSNNKTSVIITDFGPIRNFEFDINKSLIVTYGENNIGKSYAMQIVYLLFKTLIDYDIKASNIYNLIYYKNNRNLLKGPMDFYISPKYVK